METAPKAEFSFEKYLIEQASIKVSESVQSAEININFRPSGTINQTNNEFVMKLEVELSNSDKSLYIQMVLMSWFKYITNDLEKLIPFITSNAPAIVFPYIRSYISNITALGGIQPIILPTLNITNLGKLLKERIQMI